MPQSHGGLYDQLYSFGNLHSAWLAARRGKRRRSEVAEFEQALEPELLRLQEELAGGSWRPGPYRNFYVQDQKRRLVTAAPFRDRVVHHALLSILEPVFEPTFIFDSHACRKGKGQHSAIDRFQHWARRYRYVLRGDVLKFYPSVDHAILLQLLSRRIRDRQVLALCATIIESGAGVLEPEYQVAWFAEDDLFSPLARRRGLPIGNLTSQFFGNVYLDGLDHFVKEQLRCRAYLRYMDDFAVFGDDRRSLSVTKQLVGDYLAGLRLTLRRDKTRVWQTYDGVEFLGYRVFPGHRLVRKATACRYGRRLRRLGLPRVRASLAAWFGHTSHADSFRLNAELLRRAGLLAPA